MKDRALVIIVLVILFILALSTNPTPLYTTLAIVERIVIIIAGSLLIVYLLKRI